MYGNDGGSHGGPRGFAPVNVGEELDVKIEAVGEKGDGIARHKGFVLFVPGAKEGDEIRIRVTKVFRKVGFAEILGSAEGSVSTEEPAAEEAEEAPAEAAAAPEAAGGLRGDRCYGGHWRQGLRLASRSPCDRPGKAEVSVRSPHRAPHAHRSQQELPREKPSRKVRGFRD